jgi:hypothetical protein
MWYKRQPDRRAARVSAVPGGCRWKRTIGRARA